MSSEPNTPPAPDSVEARIEAARVQEKQKLYAELEALKKQVADSNVTSADMATLRNELAEAQKQLAALAKAKTAGGEVDTLALARQVADDTRAILTAAHSQEVLALKARLDEVERTNTKQRLQAHRSQVIAGYKGRIIEALVVGDTEEAITAAAVTAAKQFEDIVAQNTTPAAPGSAGTPPPPINPQAVGGGGLPPPTGLDAFKRTGASSQFAKKRSDTLAALKERYG